MLIIIRRDMNSICIITKILIILVLIVVFYKLYNESIENFDNVNYMMLNETHLDEEGTKLSLLYSNYSGEEQDKNIWENKTLNQCTDICNQLDNCVGFTRELVNDDAPAKCFPRTKISNCHTNRKGNHEQMQNAIKFNSYVKANLPQTKSVLTKCIGDPNLTLNRSIYIKSQLYPNKYFGSIGDGSITLIDIKAADFQKKCNFRIETGKDGIGTVSFLHIDTNTYLYRANIPKPTNSNVSSVDKLVLKDIIKTKTVDKQRSSFNILDAVKNLIKFKCLALDGETLDIFITINPDNHNYLSCMPVLDMQQDLYIFDIVDNTTITKSTIINKPQPSKAITKQKELFQQTDAIGNQINNVVNENKHVLSTVNNIPLYKNLFNPNKDNSNVKNYINDNYNGSSEGNFSVSKKLNDIVINNQLSKDINKKQNEYDAIKQLNLEVERELLNLNMGLNAKNDKLNNNINKMHITDMASDYFTLKNMQI